MKMVEHTKIGEIEDSIKDYIIRHDLSNGRWYSRIIDGKNIFKPSVTTVLGVLGKGIGFERWLGNSFGYEAAMEYANFAADRGTRVHINVQSLLEGIPIPTGVGTENAMPPNEIKMLMGFQKWWEDNDPQTLFCEETLWDEKFPLAGTADWIGVIDGKIHLVDWKTGKHYPTHNFQVTAYGDLFMLKYKHLLTEHKQKYPIISVLRLYEWRGRPKYDWKIYPRNKTALSQVIKLWQWHGNDTPNMPEELPEIIQLTI